MSRLDRSLVAYAFLAQAERSGNDLLSGLMPIFKPFAKEHEGDRFDPKEFATLAAELYGLNVNPWAVESLAPRLEAAGVLVRAKIADGAHEYVYGPIAEEYTTVTPTDVAFVLERFVVFARPIIAGRKEHLLDDETLKQSFLRHIVDIDFVGTLLKPARAEAGDIKMRLGLTKPAEQTEVEIDKPGRARIDVLCASFIVDLFHRDRSLYDLVARITAGALVSEVVLNFQNPETGVSLAPLRVILDAPFLMDALDLASKDAFAVASVICNQLREHGARLAVFRHSIDEVTDNLAAVIGAVEVGEGFGPTARRLSDRTFRAYATAMKTAPEARLRQERIEILEAPQSGQAYQWFTGQDEDDFCQSLGYYQNRRAQERDAASIAGVVRLRAGVRATMGKFQACRALFVTSNPWVAERSKKALLKARTYSEGHVAPAITDRYLAGLLWVVYGGKASELPSHVLLANCAAAIEPNSDLIQRMHKFLIGIDEKQAEYFRALMTDERAAQYLSQLSLGDSSYVSQDNVGKILEGMKAALLEEHELERQQESLLARKEADQRLLEGEAQQEALKDDLLTARADVLQANAETRRVQSLVDSLGQQVVAERKSRATDERRAVVWSVERARSARTVAHWGAGIFLAVLGVAAAILTNSAEHAYVRWVGLFFGGLLFLVSFWRIPEALFGARIDRFRDWVFHKALDSRGVEHDRLALVAIDWDTGDVRPVEKGGGDH